MKLSVYKDGSEAAWVTFNKPPDSDHWFDPDFIVESHPWDKTLLQESAVSMWITGPIYGTAAIEFWLISEGNNVAT